jgi:glutathione S-transferase
MEENVADQTLRLHSYWRSSSSWRVRIGLGLKGLPFELRAVNLLEGEQDRPAHRALSPLGHVPVLEVIEAGRTLVLVESMAILAYLDERFPEVPLLPPDPASMDVDEVIFYARGEFTSRRGVGPGSISHHPSGTPHGPHPGAYESSLGVRTTDELAVMLDCHHPLAATAQALATEDPGYQDSFL